MREPLIVSRTPRRHNRFALQPTRSSPSNNDMIKEQTVTVAAGASDRNEMTTVQAAQQASSGFRCAAQRGESFIRDHGQMAAWRYATFLCDDARHETGKNYHGDNRD
jgi:hypothetical protein